MFFKTIYNNISLLIHKVQNYRKIGRSFYRSPDFERERARLRATGNDFEPCSQFGIGFMSCFMLGDHITIETRRDYGQGLSYGSPLHIEIHGLSSLLVVREGRPEQEIGTTVSIVSRKKPSFVDKWLDEVQLIAVLRGYCLATEFPITGRCDIPELAESVTIPPCPERIPTLLEAAEIEKRQTLEQDLSEVDDFLNGTIRESILLDESGLPCVANDEAQWIAKKEGASIRWRLRLLPDDRTIKYSTRYGVPVCVDGILVAGTPGRASWQDYASNRLGSHNSGIQSKTAALLDVRGDLKPELTPGRIPPHDALFGRAPGWRQLDDKFRQGLGLLWEQLARLLDCGLSAEEFWKLALVHDIWVPDIPHQCLWDRVSVSLIDAEGGCCWRKMRDLGELWMVRKQGPRFELRNAKGRTVAPCKNLEAWSLSNETKDGGLRWHMNATVLLMCDLDLRDCEVVLRPIPPRGSRVTLWQYAVSHFVGVDLFLLDYVGTAHSALAVETPFATANRNHPLVVTSHDARHAREADDLQQFAKAFVLCVAHSLSPTRNDLSLEKPGYWHKRVGHLFRTVHWDRYDSSLRPPYKVWSSQKGWFDISEDVLAAWRDCATGLP